MKVESTEHRGGESAFARALTWVRPPISLTRQLIGWFVGAGSISVLTWVLALNRDSLSVASSLILFLPIVVITTVIGGPLSGLGAAIASPSVANWFLVPPYHTFRVGDWENIVELSVFVFVAFVISLFASRAARREIEAFQARSNALALSRLFERSGADEISYLLGVLCDTFGLDSASMFRCSDGVALASVERSRESLDSAERVLIDEETEVQMVGLSSKMRNSPLLVAHLSELSRCIERERLQERALEAEALTRVDELRTALLRAVSHDLRTPLAGIKAAVSGLLQDDVEWNEADRREMLRLVEGETDRLTSIVVNLLDLSRIEAGVVAPRHELCSIDEILAEASADPRFSGLIDIESMQDVMVRTDSTLLVRVIANLLENCLKWSPRDCSVTVKTDLTPSEVRVSIIDRGPGIPDDQKALVRKPFHRMSDAGHTEGLGLGLAIVDRLVEILDGRFDLLDAPGGGLVAVVSLPRLEEIE